MSGAPTPISADSGPFDESSTRVLLFDLAGRTWALVASDVDGLADCGPIRSLPGLPAEVLGFVEWRGNVLTALDLPRLLGVEGGPAPPCLVRLARPHQRVALFVPAALRMVEIDFTRLAPPPPTEELVECCLEHDRRPVWLVDPRLLVRLVERLLTGSE